MRQKCYLTLATGRVWLILYKLPLSHMGSMCDRFFRQRAYIGITRSCMRWYVRKSCRDFVEDKYSDKKSTNKGPKRCNVGCTQGCLT